MTLKNALVSAAGNAAENAYIEDVFSTYLYTGNGGTQTITNGIDLAGEGGLVWAKNRAANTFGSEAHEWYDTVRGVGNAIFSDSTSAQSAFGSSRGVTAFSTSGFTVTNSSSLIGPNSNGITEVSWTFRKAEKFFDVVTYTGNGVAGRTVAHNLGSVPGCIIIKVVTSSSIGSSDWVVYHRSTGNSKWLALNLTRAEAAGTFWNNTDPTDTHFTLGINQDVNKGDGTTYVAYLFAHDAGGFGADGTENVISCGAFTTDGSGNATVNLGWEPQWVLMKISSSSGDDWKVLDNMRGLYAPSQNAALLKPNTAEQEYVGSFSCYPNATGFTIANTPLNTTYIYIAIRRGPMKVPESGTEVFAPFATRSSGVDQANPMFNAGWPVDLLIQGFRAGSTSAQMFMPRLTNNLLRSSTTGAETNGSTAYSFTGMLGVLSASGNDSSSADICGWNFRRAPGFFDVVAYTGTGAVQNVAHNLGVAPELLIVKSRSLNGQEWPVQVLGDGTKILKLNSTSAFITNSAYWNDTGATESVFTVTGSGLTGSSGATYIAYLFASCPGVSKVGTYTGTGTTNQIDCGFSGGARYVLIKRTDSTGDWYVWDSARGIVAGNDPYLLLNSTAAEVTSTDYVDTYSAGFEISSTAPAGINASGGSYIYLAIA